MIAFFNSQSKRQFGFSFKNLIIALKIDFLNHFVFVCTIVFIHVSGINMSRPRKKGLVSCEAEPNPKALEYFKVKAV